MADCTACGTHGAYNSGFTMECLNSACRFYSEAHRKACLGNAAGFRHTEEERKVTVETPELVEYLRVSSTTTAVLCEMCYSTDGASFSLARWKADTYMECQTAGNVFLATVEPADPKAEHELRVELLSSDRTLLYTKFVPFNSANRAFTIKSGS